MRPISLNLRWAGVSRSVARPWRHLLRLELETDYTPLTLQFWTCYLLGVSSTYIDQEMADYGKVHLVAAAELVASLRANTCKEHDIWSINDIVGAFVYWDLSCSTLLEPVEQIPRSQLMSAHVKTMPSYNHTITGPFTELFYFLGDVGRYCRKVLDGHERDHLLEAAIQVKLESWDLTAQDTSWAALPVCLPCTVSYNSSRHAAPHR